MASNIKGITVEIGGDTTKLSKALASVNTQSKSLQTELNNVNKLLKLDPSNTELLSQKQNILKESINSTKEKLEQLGNVQEQVQKKFNNYQKCKLILESLTKEITETEKELKKLKEQQEKANKALEEGKIGQEQYDKISNSVQECEKHLISLKKEQNDLSKKTVNDEQYRAFQREVITTEQKLESLEKQMKDFGSVTAQQIAGAGKDIQDLGGKIEAVGKKFTIVSTAATGILAGATATTASFDDSMRQVAATMGITANEIENGSRPYEILEKAAKECGETTKYSASEAADALNYLALAGYDAEKSAETLPKVLNLAAAGNLDLATASDMVTDAMAALGLETKDLDTYIDEMARTSQKSNTSVAQLGEATLVCAGTVSMAGMSLETMNTSLGILANNGIKGAEGGTHLRNIILSLTSPTSKAAAALDDLGISVLDSQGNVRDLNEIMKDFDSSLSDLSDGEKTEIISRIFNKTDISAVNALIKGSGEEFANLSNELANCDGTAQDMADTMNSGLKGQLTLLKSQIEGIAIQLGEIIVPIIMKIIEKVSNLLTWFSGLNNTTKTIIVIILSLIAVLTPLLITIGKVVGAIGNILTFAPKIVSVINGIKTVVSSLFSLIIAHPIIAIITAIITTVVLLYTKCEWFRNMVNGILSSIVNFFVGAWNAIKESWNNVINFFSNIFNSILTLCGSVKSSLIDFFQNAIDKIKEIWTTIIDFFTSIFETIIYIFSPITELLIGFFRVAWEIIKIIWEVAILFFTYIWENIKKVFEPVILFFEEMFGNAWETIKTIWNAVIEYFSSIWEGIKAIFESVIEFFSTLFNGAWEAIKFIWSTVVAFFSSIWEGIKNIFNPIIEWFRNIFSNAWNAIKGAFSSVSNFFGGVITSIKDAFTNLPSQMLEIGKNIIDGLVNGIKSKVDSVVNAVKDIGSKITGKVKSILGIASPSRVMKAYGQYTSEGLAIGIKEKGDMASSAMENVVDDVISKTDQSALLKLGINNYGTNAGTSNVSNTSSVSNVNNTENNTYNFYSPKDSPSEYARQIRKQNQYRKLANS